MTKSLVRPRYNLSMNFLAPSSSIRDGICIRHYARVKIFSVSVTQPKTRHHSMGSTPQRQLSGHIVAQEVHATGTHPIWHIYQKWSLYFTHYRKYFVWQLIVIQWTKHSKKLRVPPNRYISLHRSRSWQLLWSKIFTSKRVDILFVHSIM